MERVELESMKGAELIAYADKLGVKVSCNKERTSLKESKANVIDKIVSFETEHTDKEEKVERHLVPMPGIEKLETLRKEYPSKKENSEKVEVATESIESSDIVKIAKSMGYELKRTNRKNAETYTFKVCKTTVELCKNKKGITLYCSKNILDNSVKVGNKFKTTNVDIYSLKTYIKEV